jgi:hypothetical protein
VSNQVEDAVKKAREAISSLGKDLSRDEYMDFLVGVCDEVDILMDAAKFDGEPK